MSRSRMLVGAWLLLAPTLARAAEEAAAHGSEHGSSFPFWHAVNLALIVGVIFYFARNPIRTFMADRRGGIEHGIEAAQRELASAEQRLAECQQRLATLDREIEEIRRSVREQAEGERTRLLADARAAAERIRRDAAIAVEQEGRSARDKLRAEVAELAVRLAGDALERQVGDADHARLVDDFVGSIATPPRQS